MSVYVMSWVWKHGPKEPTERLVLLAIADHADDGGRAYPSMAGIAEKSCVTERGARGIVRRLESDGWLATKIGGGRGGKSNYTVLMQAEPCVKPGTSVPHLGAETRNQYSGNDVPGKTINPERGDTKPGTSVPPNHQEPSLKKERTPIVPKPTKGDFEAFWEICPRKVGKGAAQKAYAKAVRETPSETIFSAMARHAREREGKDAQYTPHPATWLNQQRWHDVAPESTQDDFHNQVSQLLRGTDGLQHPNAFDHRTAQRISAPVQEARTSWGGLEPDRTPQHGRGDEQAHLRIIRPKRFGGSSG